MNSRVNRGKRAEARFSLAFALFVLASGCSSSNAPNFAEFTVDFAREVLGAWLF